MYLYKGKESFMFTLNMLIVASITGIFVAVALAGTPARIVNGIDADFGEYPYIVSVRIRGRHNCGGTILDATHILTAAHCVQNKKVSQLSIQFGVSDISDRNKNAIDVKKYIYHPKYRRGRGYKNDIAVITLESKIPLGDYASKTILPSANEWTPENQDALLIGWGTQRSGGRLQRHLKMVDIEIVSDRDCSRIFRPYTNSFNHICAGISRGARQCNGDSGGPLTVVGVQVGIVSWGAVPCARKGFPGVFVKVSSYIDWINKQVNNDKSDEDPFDNWDK